MNTANDNSAVDLIDPRRLPPVTFQLLKTIARVEGLDVDELFEDILGKKPLGINPLLAVSIVLLIYFDHNAKSSSSEALDIARIILTNATTETADLLTRVFIDGGVNFETLLHHLEKSKITSNHDFVEALKYVAIEGYSGRH